MTTLTPVLRVTEVVLDLDAPKADPKLLGYANITIEHMIVIRGIRLVRVPDSRIVVMMPGRKRSRICAGCDAVLPADHDFCGKCGDRLPWLPPNEVDRLPMDIAFPCCSAQRREIERAVLRAYDIESSRRVAEEWQATRSLLRAGA